MMSLHMWYNQSPYRPQALTPCSSSGVPLVVCVNDTGSGRGVASCATWTCLIHMYIMWCCLSYTYIYIRSCAVLVIPLTEPSLSLFSVFSPLFCPSPFGSFPALSPLPCHMTSSSYICCALLSVVSGHLVWTRMCSLCLCHSSSLTHWPWSVLFPHSSHTPFTCTRCIGVLFLFILVHSAWFRMDRPACSLLPASHNLPCQVRYRLPVVLVASLCPPTVLILLSLTFPLLDLTPGFCLACTGRLTSRQPSLQVMYRGIWRLP